MKLVIPSALLTLTLSLVVNNSYAQDEGEDSTKVRLAKVFTDSFEDNFPCPESTDELTAFKAKLDKGEKKLKSYINGSNAFLFKYVGSSKKELISDVHKGVLEYFDYCESTLSEDGGDDSDGSDDSGEF